MADDYPAFRGERVPVAAAACTAGPARVAGRLRRAGDGGLVLADASGEIALASAGAGRAGDWVSGRLRRGEDGGVALVDAVVHAPRRAGSPDPGLAARLPALRRRAGIVAAAREWFRDAGFLEVDTPARVPCPGLEPHLVAFPAGAGRWLITSPELHLKRLLAAGAERVVEFARAFRDEEQGGRWHLPEFTLLEWYRGFAGLDALEADCEALLAACARAAGPPEAPQVDGCSLDAPFQRVTVREALGAATGLDLAALGGRDELARAVAGRGHPVGADDGWDELFFRVWLAEVEPSLGRERPVFVRDWPASQAALARTRRDGGVEVAERFELYAAGVELANAFHELNDPDEQRRRHEADRAARRTAGVEVYPLDEPFLAALEAGMPPASGIALGLDRLIALLLGAGGLDEITAFPDRGAR